LSRILSRHRTDSVPQGRIQSVERALRILRGFTQPGQQASVVELGRQLGVHKSTSSRLVATLVVGGFLERTTGSEHVCLGPELVRLGRLSLSSRSLPDVAAPEMAALAQVVGETVTLSVADAGETLTIAQSAGTHAIGLQSWLGRRSPLHASSDGKTLLAFGAAQLPDGPLSACTPDTVVDRATLAAQLERAREDGWASAEGDFELGLNGVAAPIVTADGGCRAALCVSGPAYRVRAVDLAELGARCAAAAARIGALLELESVSVA
jgi:DNA-binding IclR family transcriptional regulator